MRNARRVHARGCEELGHSVNRPPAGKAIVLAAVMMAMLGVPTTVQANLDLPARHEDNLSAAVRLMRRCVTPERDGQNLMMLRALRHLRDPALEPFFDRLTRANDPTLRIHGELGVAETTGADSIHLPRLASMTDAREQAALISAALDSELLPVTALEQIASWTDLDPSVRLMISSPLIEAGRLRDAAPLRLIARDDQHLARRSLAQLQLGQLGDAQAMAQLDELLDPLTPSGRQVSGMLLETAWQYRFDRIGPWSLAMAQQTQAPRSLRMLALRVALRSRAPGATHVWREALDQADDDADRVRLAYISLKVSPEQDPAMYEPLTRSPDGLVRQIGRAARAIAAGDDPSEPLIMLIQRTHPNDLVNQWIVTYAEQTMPASAATAVLTQMVNAYDDQAAWGRAARLQEAILATQIIAECNPQASRSLVRERMADPETPEILKQALLLGLIRCRTGNPATLIEDLPLPDHPDTAGLALLLRAGADEPLDAASLDRLGLMIRGGGLPQLTLRIQAAWRYVRLTGATAPVLREAILAR